MDAVGTGTSIITLSPHESEYQRLQTLKSEIVSLFIEGDFILFQIADRILTIEREELFRAEVNQDTGEPYRSMTDYYPDLIKDLKAKASLHKLSERQVREYVRLKKVFVDSMGIPERDLLEIGPSHFTELAEALDYDHRTGEVSDTPREGKLGREDALAMLEQIRDGEWRVADTRAALNEARGVTTTGFHVEFTRWYAGEAGWKYGFNQGDRTGVFMFEGGVRAGDTGAGLTYEQAESFVKKLGATSNLQQLRGEHI